MKPDKNKELMLAAGSKTGAYDIESPDQWRWVMKHAKDPLERAMAWIKSKTTAFRHESPFCVDDTGRPLYIRHLAADMGWKEQTARNVLAELQAQGRAQVKQKRIWYCADVPQANLEPTGVIDQPEGEEPDGEEPEPNGRTRGEQINSVRRYFGDYVADFIGEQSEKQQIESLAAIENWQKRKREIFADVMAAARMQTDPIEDTILEKIIGIPKRRLPKRRPAEVKWVQLSLLQEPNPVPSMDLPRTESSDDFVDARAVVTQQQQQQKSAPRSPSSVHMDGNNSPAAAVLSSKGKAPLPVYPSPASAPIENLVARELGLDDEAAQQLVAGCKDVEPSVTGPEIVELAREKQHAMKEQVRTGKITSPVGLLIKHVPKMCKGLTLQAVRERLEAVARDRATRIGYAREAWPELNEGERAEVLQKYPELAALGAGA